MRSSNSLNLDVVVHVLRRCHYLAPRVEGTCYKVVGKVVTPDSCVARHTRSLVFDKFCIPIKPVAGSPDDIHTSPKMASTLRRFAPAGGALSLVELLPRIEAVSRRDVDVVFDGVRCSTPSPTATTVLRFQKGRSHVPVPSFPEGRPHWEQLQHVVNRVNDTFPHFFSRQLDYTFYRDDVHFVNRIYGFEVRGLRNYWIHLAAISTVARIPCPYIEMEVLSCAPLLEDGSVSVRWRVPYLNIVDFITVVLRCRSTDVEVMRKNAKWFDGRSVFYVGGDGLVYRHVADRVITDCGKVLHESKLSRLMARILGLLNASQKLPANAPF